MAGAAPDRAPDRASVRDLLLLMCAAFAMLLPGLFSLPPVDRDEPRYAVATSQMLDSHNFIDIRYQAQPRYLQPAGVYWLQSIPTALFSTPGHRAIWTFRLVSLFGAVGAVAMTGFMASRLFGRRAGLAAAVLLGACLSLGFEAKIAKTDAALLSSVVVAQFALMRAYLYPRPAWQVSAAFWAALGVGVLLKGPIILLVVGLTILALIACDRRAGWLKGLQVQWGLPLALAIALPWYMAIGLASHGEFYAIAIGHSLMGKVAAGQQAHGGPFGYHLIGFPITFWPGSLLAVLALPFVWRERRAPVIRFLLCWIIPSWIVFELVKTKLPHYVLPLFPAIACLTALALFSPKAPVRPWLRWVFAAFCALWIAVSVGLSVAAPAAIWAYLGRIDPLAVALSLPALACVAALIWSMMSRKPEWAVAAVAGAAVFTSLDIYQVAAPQLQTFWMSPRIERLAQAVKPCPTERLISTPYHEPSLVFLHGPATTLLADTPAKAAETMTSACDVALVGQKQAPAFLARAAALSRPVRPLGQVTGRDYADGKTLTLTLYGAGQTAPPAPLIGR